MRDSAQYGDATVRHSESLPQGPQAALVLLWEQLRSDAAETIAYIAAQGMALKMISGEARSPSAPSRRVPGCPTPDRPVDAREPPDDLGSLGRLIEERSSSVR
ncbi:MAG TPA: hypothetical protein VMS92_22475 [Mycobacterium sp.]|nr:hypothetical protein [Mycobacterium sp.]